MKKWWDTYVKYQVDNFTIENVHLQNSQWQGHIVTGWRDRKPQRRATGWVADHPLRKQMFPKGGSPCTTLFFCINLTLEYKYFIAYKKKEEPNLRKIIKYIMLI